MPWTINDVDSFKKGLTPEQKKQWVFIANTVHSRCKQAGGSEEQCNTSAIRQANIKVDSNSFEINTKNENYQIRVEEHQGRQFFVVPVTMMVEGVHNGSRGPLYHSIDELGKFPEAWNGIPVTINHPEVDGQNVSANSPDIIDSVTVGRVYNTFTDGNKLKAEAWLDSLRLQQVSPDIFAAIQNAQVIEVSVGVFTDEEQVQGNWNNEQYTAIARNHRPDHLALLPGGTGACSVQDGCGVRTNSKTNKKGENNVKEEEIEALKEQRVQKIIETNGEAGFNEKVNAARRKVDSMDNDMVVHYLLEMYDSYVIYEARNRNTGSSKMYKQNYSFNTDNTIALNGEPQQVVQQISYNPVSTNNNNKNQEGKMENNNQNPPCGQCMEKVVAIINSNKTPYTADHREWLLQQNEEFLNKLMPVEETPAPIPQSNTVKLTSQDVLQALSEDDRAALQYGKTLLAQRREGFIKGIQANTDPSIWPIEDLKKMDDLTLERVYNSVAKKEPEIDYSVLGSMRTQVNAAVEEPLYMPGVEITVK